LILVVEDDKGIQELLRFTLVCGAYQPLCADSCRRGRGSARAAACRIIALIDWMLPGKSGLLLTRKLRSDRRTQQAADHPVDRAWRGSRPRRRPRRRRG
jgi:two-component system phosphate regulon response regulator PhoB